MNHDDPTHRAPTRAEPLQPDRPGHGAQKDQGSEGAPGQANQDERSQNADKLKEQSEVAVENVREGFGR